MRADKEPRLFFEIKEILQRLLTEGFTCTKEKGFFSVCDSIFLALGHMGQKSAQKRQQAAPAAREGAAAETYTKQKALLSKEKKWEGENRRACCESVGAEMKRFCSSDSNDARSAA